MAGVAGDAVPGEGAAARPCLQKLGREPVEVALVDLSRLGQALACAEGEQQPAQGVFVGLEGALTLAGAGVSTSVSSGTAAARISEQSFGSRSAQLERLMLQLVPPSKAPVKPCHLGVRRSS